MKVSAAEVSEQFDLLLGGEREPGAGEEWAAARMRAFDEGRLLFDPPADEDRIWEGISYLLGVGLRVAPDRYLHCREDFLDFCRATGL